jgi:hypothetical protein
MQLIGIYFGLYVLVTIGLYHILIVKLEARWGSRPWVAFLLLGLAFVYLSAAVHSSAWSMFWGYNAFINLWSIKEMFDQTRRMGRQG